MRFTNTNWNLYRSFLTVYEKKNMHRAAEILGISRPAVGQNVRELANQLGATLFISHRKGVEPTTEAHELYKEIEPAISRLCFSERNILAFNEASHGVIKIACTTNFVTYYLTEHICRFNKKYPNIQFDITKRSPDEAVKMLQNQETDFIISNHAPHIDKRFHSIQLDTLSETFIASRHIEKEYNLTPTISVKQFEKLPFIAIRGRREYKTPTATAESLETVFQMVKNNLGVGVCLNQFLEINHPNDDIFKFNVTGISLQKSTLNCTYDKLLISKAANAFIDDIKEFSQHQPQKPAQTHQ